MLGHLSAAYVYEAMGSTDKGMALLDGLDHTVQVDTPVILFLLAEMQFSANQADKAKETVAAYRRAYPEHYPVFDYFAGREFLLKGAPEEAAAKFAAVTNWPPLLKLWICNSRNLIPRATTLESYLRTCRTTWPRVTCWNAPWANRKRHGKRKPTCQICWTKGCDRDISAWPPRALSGPPNRPKTGRRKTRPWIPWRKRSQAA